MRVVASAALCWGVVYLVWRIGWSGHGTPLALFLPLLAAEAFGWCSLAMYAFFAWRAPTVSVRPVPEHATSVKVFVCTYDESSSVLEPTLLGCAAITAPHTTCVLDDGRRPEIRELPVDVVSCGPFDADHYRIGSDSIASPSRRGSCSSRTAM